MPTLDKLIEISSEPISSNIPYFEEILFEGINNNLIEELKCLLVKKNGFLAFESALHIYPAINNISKININNWNQKALWKKYYDLDKFPLLFFGQDIFMCQFALSTSGIIRFEPETGILENHSKSIEEWANKIIKDYNYETGWELAHEWQINNHPIYGDQRLLPKIPFVLGGQYDTSNLIAVDTFEAIKMLGKLHEYIKNIPDGTRVTLDWWLK